MVERQRDDERLGAAKLPEGREQNRTEAIRGWRY